MNSPSCRQTKPNAASGTAFSPVEEKILLSLITYPLQFETVIHLDPIPVDKGFFVNVVYMFQSEGGPTESPSSL